MQNFSTTQASNITTFVGVLGFILPLLHINIASDELTQFISAALAIGGLMMNWYNRYQQGDLTAAGFRKS